MVERKVPGRPFKVGHGKLRGRKKGVPNKITLQLKEMVLKSLEMVGGERYLARQADERPDLYFKLLIQVLPHTILTNAPGTVQMMALPAQVLKMCSNEELNVIEAVYRRLDKTKIAPPQPLTPNDDDSTRH